MANTSFNYGQNNHYNYAQNQYRGKKNKRPVIVCLVLAAILVVGIACAVFFCSGASDNGKKDPSAGGTALTGKSTTSSDSMFTDIYEPDMVDDDEITGSDEDCTSSDNIFADVYDSSVFENYVIIGPDENSTSSGNRFADIYDSNVFDNYVIVGPRDENSQNNYVLPDDNRTGMTCPICRGNRKVTCNGCGGSGGFYRTHYSPSYGYGCGSSYQEFVPCYTCGGSRVTDCLHCYGTGVIG